MRNLNKYTVNDRSQNIRLNNRNAFLNVKAEQQNISVIIE